MVLFSFVLSPETLERGDAAGPFSLGVLGTVRAAGAGLKLRRRSFAELESGRGHSEASVAVDFSGNSEI